MGKVVINVKGVEQLVKDYGLFIEQLSDMSEPMEESGTRYLNVIHTNFVDEGKTFGEPWPRLSPGTIRAKRSLYKKGQAIAIEKPLVRTGVLRKSFNKLASKMSGMVYNSMDYAGLHQDGGKTRIGKKVVSVPRRVLADVDEERENMVAGVFLKWVNKLVSSNKL
jgi:phage gpG-like protein